MPSPPALYLTAVYSQHTAEGSRSSVPRCHLIGSSPLHQLALKGNALGVSLCGLEGCQRPQVAV